MSKQVLIGVDDSLHSAAAIDAADARVVVADPRAALLDAARSEHMNLVIVGSHGRTGIKKLLLGSVATHVVTHAPCSVLVVREGETQRG